MPSVQRRRRFLSNLAFAGATGLCGAGAAGFLGTGRTLGAEPPPETTEIRLKRMPSIAKPPNILQRSCCVRRALLFPTSPQAQ